MLNKYIKAFRNVLLLSLTVIISAGCSNISDITGGKKTSTQSTSAVAKVTMSELTADVNIIALTWINPSDTDLKSVNITWTDGTTPGSFEVSDGSLIHSIPSLSGTTEYTITLTTEDTGGNKSDTVSFSVSTSSTMTYFFIYTATDLNAVRGGETGYDTWTLGGNYILMADVDLSAYSPWTPIGDIDGFFTGIFECNDHVINNLTINSSNDYLGLFGVTDTGSQIKHLGVRCTMIKSGDASGGLVGVNQGTISNCYVTGTISSIISANGMLGGLVGMNAGIINNCYFTGTVTGTSYVGGLVGINNGGIISSSYATGSLNGDGGVGGLVGMNMGTINNCYATGSVTGTSKVGGLVGYSLGLHSILMQLVM